MFFVPFFAISSQIYSRLLARSKISLLALKPARNWASPEPRLKSSNCSFFFAHRFWSDFVNLIWLNAICLGWTRNDELKTRQTRLQPGRTQLPEKVYSILYNFWQNSSWNLKCFAYLYSVPIPNANFVHQWSTINRTWYWYTRLYRHATMELISIYN